AAYLQSLFTGIGTGGEQWSGTMTQYCDGERVAKGATSCPAGAPHVGYPRAGLLAGVWFDGSAASPANATAAQLAQEAVNAARHFGNTSADSNRYALYFIVSPSGAHPDGFGTTGGFCGWHDFTSSSFGDIAYANLPYVSDLGTSCGANFVNRGAARDPLSKATAEQPPPEQARLAAALQLHSSARWRTIRHAKDGRDLRQGGSFTRTTPRIA